MTYVNNCAQCERPFESRRPDAKTCSEECKYQRWIEVNLETPQPVTGDVRRASRDGKGAKVYLTLWEIHDLQQGRPGQKTYDKLNRAAQRLIGVSS